jgi:hypothetical protein
MEETSPDSPDPASNADAPKLNYALVGGGPPREIAVFADLAEARITATVMDGMGLRTRVEEAKPIHEHRKPAGRLLVREGDAGRAIELLASTPLRKWLTVPPAEIPPAKVLAMQSCPKCESEIVQPTSVARPVMLAALMLCWIPLFIPYGWIVYISVIGLLIVALSQRHTWRCRACGHRWREA